jgi:hypothetical protein
LFSRGSGPAASSAAMSMMVRSPASGP